MSFIDAIILGIVEGLTEFLPVSSTGHLILTAKFLKIADSDFLKSFEIAIQLGATMAVVVYYWPKLTKNFQIYQKVSAAFLPTMLIGLIFYKMVKNYLMDNTAVVVWALFVGGFVLILFEKYHKENIEAATSIQSITYRQAVLIGIFQSVALIPGVSRAGATILGGLLLGLRRKTIVEFSFLLAIPTLMAATALDLTKSHFLFSSAEWMLLAAGLVMAFGTALAVIGWFLSFIQKHSFIPFGVYRVVAGIVCFKWLLG